MGYFSEFLLFFLIFYGFCLDMVVYCRNVEIGCVDIDQFEVTESVFICLWFSLFVVWCYFVLWQKKHI